MCDILFVIHTFKGSAEGIVILGSISTTGDGRAGIGAVKFTATIRPNDVKNNPIARMNMRLNARKAAPESDLSGACD